MIKIAAAGPCELVKFVGSPENVSDAYQEWAAEEARLRDDARSRRIEGRRAELAAIERKQRIETWRNGRHIGSAGKGLLRRVAKILRAA
ncbi:MAG: hypothetical protein U0166_02905 [Acidobacteriota bacterium]